MLYKFECCILFIRIIPNTKIILFMSLLNTGLPSWLDSISVVSSWLSIANVLEKGSTKDIRAAKVRIVFMLSDFECSREACLEIDKIPLFFGSVFYLFHRIQIWFVLSQSLKKIKLTRW